MRDALRFALEVVIGTILIWLFVLILSTATSDARPRPAQTPAVATWYGPGFYHHKFACAWKPGLPTIYWSKTRGTAHMSLPCGTWVTICYRGRCVRVQVIDSGNFGRNNFDVTAQTAMDLCACKRPHTMNIHWRRGR